MEITSPFLAMEQVERQLKSMLRGIDIDSLSPVERKLGPIIRRQATDVRLDIRDYELSETREEQLKCAAAAQIGLTKLQASILSASPVFGAADVAQLSAQLGYIHGRII